MLSRICWRLFHWFYQLWVFMGLVCGCTIVRWSSKGCWLKMCGCGFCSAWWASWGHFDFVNWVYFSWMTIVVTNKSSKKPVHLNSLFGSFYPNMIELKVSSGVLFIRRMIEHVWVKRAKKWILAYWFLTPNKVWSADDFSRLILRGRLGRSTDFIWDGWFLQLWFDCFIFSGKLIL